jgi:hypothetical protein
MAIQVFEKLYRKYEKAMHDMAAAPECRPGGDFQIEKVTREAADIFRTTDPQKIAWFKAALGKEQLKWYAAAVLAKVEFVPRDLAFASIESAVNEPCPSFNRKLLLPSVRSLGCYEVSMKLLDIVEMENNWQKAGALNALLWAASRSFPISDACRIRPDVADPNPESSRLMETVRQRCQKVCLVEFVKNSDLDAQRALVRWVSINESDYPPELQPLAKQAHEIAINHPDDFIRNRVLQRSSDTPLFEPLPDRGAPLKTSLKQPSEGYESR